MMWVKVKYDKLGRMWPISEHQDKSELRGLKANEGVIEAEDLGSVATMAAAHNSVIAAKYGHVQPDSITRTEKPTGIDPKKISTEGIELIREFLNTGSDLAMGKLMTIHNQEQWSEAQFCCGSQKETLARLINDLILNHGIQLGLQ